MEFVKIIRVFGTQKALANALQIDQSTVSQWKRRGLIPTNRIKEILACTKHLDASLTPADFFSE